ncbi:hypothetical protein Golax_020495 [Gossypium laxum]|uniref:DUF4283 domain-containing protein n=1 Tax=Gossypium laxum TaxID=34288 RepID=A0A7J9B0Y6_9ROSI|nr:hypothetical protein [Gossypium laxum]
MVVPLVFTNFWVQIHDLPSGLMSKDMARQFRNFIGKFWSMIQKLRVRVFGLERRVMFFIWISYEEYQEEKCLLGRKMFKSSDFEDEENVDPNLDPIEEDSPMEIQRKPLVDSPTSLYLGYRLPLLDRSAGRYETFKLECPSVEEPSGCVAPLARTEGIEPQCGFFH